MEICTKNIHFAGNYLRNHGNFVISHMHVKFYIKAEILRQN